LEGKKKSGKKLLQERPRTKRVLSESLRDTISVSSKTRVGDKDIAVDKKKKVRLFGTHEGRAFGELIHLGTSN